MPYKLLDILMLLSRESRFPGCWLHRITRDMGYPGGIAGTRLVLL